MHKSLMIAAALALPLSMAASAQEAAKTAPPAAPYQQVSKLVKLPDFIPGLGSLFVDPSTLPAGPFVAYDRTGKLATTIYMIPLEDLQAQKNFDDLGVGASTVTAVDMHYNAGHPGVENPHYHVVLWHGDKSSFDLK